MVGFIIKMVGDCKKENKAVKALPVIKPTLYIKFLLLIIFLVDIKMAGISRPS